MKIFMGLVVVLFLIVATAFLVVMIKEIVSDAVREFMAKHRYNTPPIAECYCKDCRYFRSNRCIYMNGSLSESCFCWRAQLPLSD